MTKVTLHAVTAAPFQALAFVKKSYEWEGNSVSLLSLRAFTFVEDILQEYIHSDILRP